MAQPLRLSNTAHAWYDEFRPNRTAEYPHDKCLQDLFEAQCQRWPDKIALRDGSRTWTYAELHTQVSCLSQHLSLDAGACPEQVVGLFMERCAEFVIGYLAILKAGAAYMPLEVAYPSGLLTRVLADATPCCVLTNSKWADSLPESQLHFRLDDDNNEKYLTSPPDAQAVADAEAKRDQMVISKYSIDVDSGAQSLVPMDVSKCTPDSLGYIVYSSGTTGNPKGIMCPQRGAVHSYDWRHKNAPFQDDDIVASNVFFVWEVIRCLCSESPVSVVVIPDDVIYDPQRLVPFFAQHKATRVLFTPSLLQACLDAPADVVNVTKDMASLNTIVLCGEVVTATLRARTKMLLPNVRILNLFSISECHDVSQADITCGNSHDGKYCSVGPIMSNVDVQILNDSLHPVELGETGEIYVSGVTLARGYLNMPQRTKKRFFNWTDPTADDAKAVRVYHTGDRGYIRPDDGHLIVLGRCDSMVKIRGYSVVLDAVEVAIVEHEDIKSCCVMVEGDEGDDKRLVGYIVMQSGVTDLTVADLQRFLVKRLPQYSIPAVYVRLERLPLSDTTGKAHRKKLPALDKVDPALLLPPGSLATDDSRVLTATEETVVKIWMDVLQLEHVGVEDNFFVLGGHSLSAARIVARVNERYGTSIHVSKFFQLASPAAVASEVDGIIGITGDAKSTSASFVVSASPLIKAAASTPNLDVPLMLGSLSDQLATPASQHHASSAYHAMVMQPLRSSVHHNTPSISSVPPVMLDNDFDADCHLQASIRPPKLPAGVQRRVAMERVFLTGATGFLGAHILAALLQQKRDLHVVCLVRADSTEQGLARLRANLDNYKLLSGRVLARFDSGEAVRAVTGDLTKEYFGLQEMQFTEIAAHVDVIIHNAARVNLMYPYQFLKGVNVGGTQEAIRMACHPHKSVSAPDQKEVVEKALVFVSTLGVFQAGDYKSDEDSALNKVQSLDGYGQTKVVAERLVHEARERGLRASIVRPGNMAPHSAHGVWNPHDFYYLMFKACASLRAFPDISQFSPELTPVDYASNSIVLIARDLFAVSEPPIRSQFHICHPNRVDYEQLVSRCIASGDNVSPLANNELCTFNDWKRLVLSSALQIAEQKKNTSTSTAGDTDNVIESFASMLSEFDNPDSLRESVFTNKCGKTIDFLKAASKRVGDDSFYACPHIDENLMDKWMSSFAGLPHDRSGSVASAHATSRPVRNPAQPLGGKIAIVTGASSGIGAAVAYRLAAEGARVVLVARRLAPMQDLARQIHLTCVGAAADEKLLALPISCDVSDIAQVRAMASQCESTFGVPDILVNCAGLMYWSYTTNCRLEDWDKMVKVNCSGVMNCCGAVLQKMIERKSGHIVTISSDAGRSVFTGLTVYSATKFFVEAFMRGLRTEIAPHGLRATVLQPGDVRTPIAVYTTEEDAAKCGDYLKDDNVKILEPTDIADAVMFALSQPKHIAVNEMLIEPQAFPIS
jgi:amino acid adenylation domain-containing protein/thioester reductase-like protein